jgi:hypothetical protein
MVHLQVSLDGAEKGGGVARAATKLVMSRLGAEESL